MVFLLIRGKLSRGKYLSQFRDWSQMAMLIKSKRLQRARSFLIRSKFKIPSLFIQIKNARTALARLAAEFYGCPDKSLNVIAVTGTNGKTTTTYLIRSILEAGGHSVGLLGTIEYFVGNEKIPAERTTPESLDLQRLSMG